MAGGSWSTAAVGVHPGLEVVPSLLCQVDFAPRDLAGVLAEDVQKYDQIPRATIEHSVELGTVVAAELAQFAFDLRTVGKRKVWFRRGEHVQAVDLVVEGDLLLGGQTLNEGVNRLRAISLAVVDRLKVCHVPRLVAALDGLQSTQGRLQRVRCARAAGGHTVAADAS